MSEMPRGAVVEIVDDGAGGPGNSTGILTPSRVLIDGHDAGLLAEGGVHVHAGSPSELTTVTLTLLPSRVVMRGPDPASAGHEACPRTADGGVNPACIRAREAAQEAGA